MEVVNKQASPYFVISSHMDFQFTFRFGLPWVVGWVQMQVEEGLHAVVVVVELLHQPNAMLLAGVPGFCHQVW